MFLHTVADPLIEKEWLHLPLKLYSNYANRPLMLVDDIQSVFDAASNSFLHQGKTCRWLAYDQYNLCAGRIAAFSMPGDPLGRIGFFECTNDKAVAHALFYKAKDWLASLGCT